MNPGATIMPDASKTSASFLRSNFPGLPRSWIWSPSRSTSRAASVREAGSRTRPFLISSIFLRVPFLWNGFRCARLLRAVRGTAIVCDGLGGGRMRALFADDEQVENSHAHGDAVGDLLEHTGLRAVGHVRGDFNAAVHRAWVQDERVGFGALEAFRVQLVAVNVVVGGDGCLVLALGLHAQHDDHVGVFQSFFNVVN